MIIFQKSFGIGRRKRSTNKTGNQQVTKSSNSSNSLASCIYIEMNIYFNCK
jgi:hypothetical protein